MKKMGPIQKVLSMIPGLGYSLPKEDFEVAEKKIERWKAIIQSMTIEERENPKVLNASRIKRIARGSGTKEVEIRELIKQFNTMKKMFKSLKGKRGLLGKLPLKLRGL
jgi:signal recognition particle subunit SRP54